MQCKSSMPENRLGVVLQATNDVKGRSGALLSRNPADRSPDEPAVVG
jgi:hypothetical protein